MNCITRCDLVLKEVDDLHKKAHCLFDKSKVLVEYNIGNSILLAIRDLKKAIFLMKEGLDIETEADTLLTETGCGEKCIEEACQMILDMANAEYMSQLELQKDALCLLLQSLEKLQLSIEHNTAGNLQYKEYITCINKKPFIDPCPKKPLNEFYEICKDENMPFD